MSGPPVPEPAQVRRATYCHHGVATYMYRCGKCEMEDIRREEARMLTEAFNRLADVLDRLEAKL